MIQRIKVCFFYFLTKRDPKLKRKRKRSKRDKWHLSFRLLIGSEEHLSQTLYDLTITKRRIFLPISLFSFSPILYPTISLSFSFYLSSYHHLFCFSLLVRKVEKKPPHFFAGGKSRWLNYLVQKKKKKIETFWLRNLTFFVVILNEWSLVIFYYYYFLNMV